MNKKLALLSIIMMLLSVLCVATYFFYKTKLTKFRIPEDIIVTDTGSLENIIHHKKRHNYHISFHGWVCKPGTPIRNSHVKLLLKDEIENIFYEVANTQPVKREDVSWYFSESSTPQGINYDMSGFSSAIKRKSIKKNRNYRIYVLSRYNGEKQSYIYDTQQYVNR